MEIGCSRVTFVLCATPLDVFWPVTFSSTHTQSLSLVIDINGCLVQSVSIKLLAEFWTFSYSSIGSTVIVELTNQTLLHPTQNSSVRKPPTPFDLNGLTHMLLSLSSYAVNKISPPLRCHRSHANVYILVVFETSHLFKARSSWMSERTCFIGPLLALPTSRLCWCRK